MDRHGSTNCVPEIDRAGAAFRACSSTWRARAPFSVCQRPRRRWSPWDTRGLRSATRPPGDRAKHFWNSHFNLARPCHQCRALSLVEIRPVSAKRKRLRRRKMAKQMAKPVRRWRRVDRGPGRTRPRAWWRPSRVWWRRGGPFSAATGWRRTRRPAPASPCRTSAAPSSAQSERGQKKKSSIRNTH